MPRRPRAPVSSTQPLHIRCNYPFNPAAAGRLRRGVGAHQIDFSTGENTGIPPRSERDDPAAAKADILLGQPPPEILFASQRVRWVEITSAGYTNYDRDDLRRALRDRGAMLTNASRVFDEGCAQHLAAMILSLARELPRCLDNQRGARVWLHEEPRIGRRFLLNGQTAVIYGFGAIARRLVEILRPFGMRLWGVRRAPRGDEGIPILTESEADDRLGEMDHVVDILPANDSTTRYFSAARFARFKSGARFYNIGRGTTVDQDALIEALRSSCVDAAYLDVTDPEPLNLDHPLWSTPNCYVTPHIGGTHSNEEERLVEHFLANLRAFEAGQSLVDRVI